MKSKQMYDLMLVAMLNKPELAQRIAKMSEAEIEELLQEFATEVKAKRLGFYKVKYLTDQSMHAYSMPMQDLEIDTQKHMIRGVISCETLDRSRDIVVTKGIDFENHKKNPLVLFNHQRDLPAIGHTQDPTGRYTVEVHNDHAVATIYFFKELPFAQQVMQLVDCGAVRALSVGILAKPGAVRKTQGTDGYPIQIIEACELVEISLLPFPDNPDCLVLPLTKGLGGSPLLPELRKVITSMHKANKALGTMDDTMGGTLHTNTIDPPSDLKMDAPMDADVPAGAMALQAIYEHILMGMDLLETLEKKQEPDSGVVEKIQEVRDAMTTIHSDIVDLYTSRYPDLPPLEDPVDSMDDLEADADIIDEESTSNLEETDEVNANDDYQTEDKAYEIDPEVETENDSNEEEEDQWQMKRLARRRSLRQHWQAHLDKWAERTERPLLAKGFIQIVQKIAPLAQQAAHKVLSTSQKLALASLNKELASYLVHPEIQKSLQNSYAQNSADNEDLQVVQKTIAQWNQSLANIESTVYSLTGK